jgi:hypothetical protein
MKCEFIKSNGKQCSASAMKNSKQCFYHNPTISQRRKKEAQSKGGKANKIALEEPLEPIGIKNLRDVVLLLENTINRVRMTKMDTKIANCIFYGSGQIIRAMEISDLEKRVEEIEKTIKERLK